jgi:restriction system protein
MTQGMKRIWGLRAGKKGRAHDNFISDGVIVLADAEMGDLGELESSRDAFYEKYRGLHPDDTRTGSAGIAGKFFRFAIEMNNGDLVVYPALLDKQVYVGEIVGDYRFVTNSDYPHQRSVKWKFVIPKSVFSIQARYELGAARTLFEVKRCRDELLKRISSEGVTRFNAKSHSKR